MTYLRRHLTVEDLRAWNRSAGHLSASLKTLIRRRAKLGGYWLFFADDRVAFIWPNPHLTQGYSTQSYFPGKDSTKQLWRRLRVEDRVAYAHKLREEGATVATVAHSLGVPHELAEEILGVSAPIDLDRVFSQLEASR